MKIIEILNSKSKELRNQIGIIYYAAMDKRTGFAPKIIIGIAILYAASPIDLIPDFIPILGYLDDLIILPGLIWLAIKLVPKEVIIDSKEKAIHNPIKLGRNWFFGVFIIGIWTLIAITILKIVFEKIKIA